MHGRAWRARSWKGRGKGADKIRTSCHRGVHQTDDKTDGEKSEAPNLKYICSEGKECRGRAERKEGRGRSGGGLKELREREDSVRAGGGKGRA